MVVFWGKGRRTRACADDLIPHTRQNVLRDSNRTTLRAVSAFVREAPGEGRTKIPAALIVTGPNIASQDLLFSQLGESLGEGARGGAGRFVRLRSAEAPNLKATLKKVIRDVTRSAAEDDGQGEDVELAVGKDVSVTCWVRDFGGHECVTN